MVSYRYFNCIQVLRAVAAISVCCFHISFWWNQEKDVLAGLFDRASVGVDLFFVISGFVIFQWVKKSPNGFKPFLNYVARRFNRIYPTYWVVIFVFIITGAVTYTEKGITDFLKTFFLFPGHKEIIIVSWTLAYELYYYLLLSLYVLDNRFKWVLVAVFSLAVISAINTISNETLMPGLKERAIYSQLTLEFFLGIGVYYLFNRITTVWAVILVVMGTIFLFYPYSLASPRVLISGLPAMSLVAGSLALENNNFIRMPGWLKKCGDASYSLYLIHIPMINVLITYTIKYKLMLAGIMQRVELVAIIVTVVVVAIIFHFSVEKPLINILNKKLGSKKATFS